MEVTRMVVNTLVMSLFNTDKVPLPPPAPPDPPPLALASFSSALANSLTFQG